MSYCHVLHHVILLCQAVKISIEKDYTGIQNFWPVQSGILWLKSGSLWFKTRSRCSFRGASYEASHWLTGFSWGPCRHDDRCSLKASPSPGLCSAPKQRGSSGKGGGPPQALPCQLMRKKRRVRRSLFIWLCTPQFEICNLKKITCG